MIQIIEKNTLDCSKKNTMPTDHEILLSRVERTKSHAKRTQQSKKEHAWTPNALKIEVATWYGMAAGWAKPASGIGGWRSWNIPTLERNLRYAYGLKI